MELSQFIPNFFVFMFLILSFFFMYVCLKIRHQKSVSVWLSIRNLICRPGSARCNKLVTRLTVLFPGEYRLSWNTNKGWGVQGVI